MVKARNLAWGLAFAATTALTVAPATPASAAASFDGLATGVLTIVGITGPDPISDLFIDGDAIVFDLDSSASGALGTFASASGDADFLGGGLSQRADVSGTALPTGLPGSLASAFYFTEGFLSIENLGSDRYDIQFQLDWSVSATATADNPSLENAFAEALVELTGDVDFTALADADTTLGDAGETLANVEIFSLTLSPGDFVQLFLVVDAQGSAASVPVTGALPLMAAGLFGLGLIARRRR